MTTVMIIGKPISQQPEDRRKIDPIEICATPDRDRAIVPVCKGNRLQPTGTGKQSSVEPVLFNESARDGMHTYMLSLNIGNQVDCTHSLTW